MCRSRRLSVVVGLAVLACGGRAPAQPPGMAGPATGDTASPLLIAMAPVVQDELKLSTDQKTKVYDLVRSLSQKQRELMQTIFLSGGTNPQVIFQARDSFRREMEQSLGKILDKKQNERFLQIVLRAEGPLAVARPEIASRLGLNAAKTEQVQMIAVQLQQAQRQLFMRLRMNGVAAGGEGFNRDTVNQFTAASNNLRKEAVQQIGRLLTKDQRDAFDKMLGEPFELSKLQSTDPNAPADSANGAATNNDKDAPTASDDAPKPEGKGKMPAKKKTRKGR